MSAESICDLVEGRVVEWHGLQPFAIDEVPDCIGEQRASEWLKFKRGYGLYRIFRSGPQGPEVWLFSFNGKSVELVELFSPPLSFASDETMDELGQPKLIGDYPGAAQIQRPLAQPGEELREAIYGQRGLALLLGYAPGRPARPVRVRGFPSMSEEEYYERFVELPEIEIPA